MISGGGWAVSPTTTRSVTPALRISSSTPVETMAVPVGLRLMWTVLQGWVTWQRGQGLAPGIGWERTGTRTRAEVRMVLWAMRTPLTRRPASRRRPS